MTGETDAWPYFPFCSRRCKTIDLGRWLDGRNWLPAHPEEEEVPEDPESEFS
jgi:endogenous inhibitor of DNA gyrase (YacG/DUF329 family)